MKRLLTLALILFAAMLVLPPAALARDKPGDKRPAAKQKFRGDAAAQLTAEELEFLRSKMPWDKLDPNKQQRIARTILYLRDAPESKRKDFLRRARDFHRRGDLIRGHAGHMLANRGLARAALKRLGLPFEAELHRRDLSQHAFEMAIQMTFWRNVTEGMTTEDLPAADQQKLKDEADPKKRERMRRGLAYRAAKTRANAWRQELAQAAADPSALVDAVGRKAVETWPEAFAKTVSDRDYLLRKTESVEVRRGITRLIRRSDRLGKDESLLLVRLVDRWATRNRRNEEPSGSQADAILKSVLVKELRVPQDVVDGIPPRSDPEARARYLQEQFRRSGFRMHDGKKARGGKNGRRPGGRPRVEKKPDGVSDKDMALIRKAMMEARKARRLGEWLRMEQKPDGVSDEGWQAFKKAADASFRPFEGRRKR